MRGLLFAGLRQHNHSLTCWKESSKSVCLETLIFTWLGRAFDWKKKTGERKKENKAQIRTSVITIQSSLMSVQASPSC